MPTIKDIPQDKIVNLKDKIAIVYDDGCFLELAKTLSKSFKKVYYFNSWKCEFPVSQDYYIGHGIEGIECVNNFWDYVDTCDIFIFPSIYYGDIQVHLEKMGKRVWGSRKGEEMEIYRDKMKEYMKKLGLFVTPYTVVKGMDNLRKYLESHENVYVKVNMTRGDFETFHSPKYELIEEVLNNYEHKLGATAKIKEFIVENALDDSVECGTDCYTIDGQYPTRTLVGIEVKDLGYVGRIVDYDKLSPKMTDFNYKISPALKKYGYKGFISTEIRVSRTKPPYMVDLCCRMPSPPNELFQLMYKNLAEIIWYGAEGFLIDPITEKEFGVEAMILSSWLEHSWQIISFPEEYRDNVKLKHACFVDGKYYCSPTTGYPEIGAIVAEGDTLEEAVEMAKKIADSIQGYYIDVEVGSIDKAVERFKQLEKFGVKIL